MCVYVHVCVCMCDTELYHIIITNLCLCCGMHVTCLVSSNHLSYALYQLFIFTKGLCCRRICHHRSPPNIVHSEPNNCYWSLLGKRKRSTHDNVFRGNFWKVACLQALWRAGCNVAYDSGSSWIRRIGLNRRQMFNCQAGPLKSSNGVKHWCDMCLYIWGDDGQSWF